MAPAPAVGAAGKRPELYAGGLPFLDLWGLHTLLPCAQGILEGPPAQDESLWLEYCHHVSAVPLSPIKPGYQMGAPGVYKRKNVRGRASPSLLLRSAG
jgi:hypothetical protein